VGPNETGARNSRSAKLSLELESRPAGKTRGRLDFSWRLPVKLAASIFEREKLWIEIYTCCETDQAESVRFRNIVSKY
jgi:hypothetical protein